MRNYGWVILFLTSCGSGIDLKTVPVNYYNGVSSSGSNSSGSSTQGNSFIQQTTIFKGDQVAQSFSAQSSITPAQVIFKAARVEADAAFTVEIHPAGGTYPDSLAAIASGEGSVAEVSGTQTSVNLMSSISLEKGARYWIVVTPTSNHSTHWFGTGLSNFGEKAARKNISGASWVDLSADIYFEIHSIRD